MAKQTINIGSAANDGTGSTLRAAFDITNDNFTELYDGSGGLLHKIEGTNFTGSLLVGHSTTGVISSAQYNTGIGIAALDALTSGDQNVAVGYNVLTATNTGYGNTAIGAYAGDALTSGYRNVAIGNLALSTEDTHGYNVAIGYNALTVQNAGADAYNVAVGASAGASVTTGVQNTIIGGLAGDALTTGFSNVAIGHAALGVEDTGAKNTAIGYYSLLNLNYDGNGYNTAVGYYTGLNITTGTNNTIIGGLAGDALTEGSNNIIIGYNAAASAVDVSNEVTIGDSNISNVRIPSDSTLKIGASGDLQLEHLSSNSFIKNTAVGDLYIENQVDDKDIIFRSDDGSGGLATYFYLDGSIVENRFSKATRHSDNIIAKFGDANDLNIYSNGSNSYIENFNNDFIISNTANDQDIKFFCDDDSGGVTEYFRLDGGLALSVASKHIRFEDSVEARFGTGGDARIFHDATDTYFDNFTGDLYIRNSADDKDIIFQSDDGSGGLETYFFLDGSLSGGNPVTIFPDNSTLRFGSSGDLQLYHDASNSYIAQTGTGDLYIRNTTDDKDVIFQSDDGSGGLATYFYLDGGGSLTRLEKKLRGQDNVQIQVGSAGDFEMVHDGTDTKLNNYTGQLYITNESDDKDIIFRSDNGAGSFTEYFRLDGGTVTNIFSQHTNFIDSKKALFGTGSDLEIYHNGTDSKIENTNGDLVISNYADDKDIIFQSDDGSGGITEYFKLDGSSKRLDIADSIPLCFGAGDDLQIQHNGSTSYIQNYTGDLQIQNNSDGDDILFRCDDGSGGLTTYFYLNGGDTNTNFQLDTLHPDNVKAKFGTSADLQIYHDGSGSYIKDSGTGALTIMSSANLYLKSSAGEKYAQGSADGTFKIYYNNTKKLETTSTGVEVTGTVDVTQSSASVPVLRLTDDGICNYDFIFPDDSTIKLETSTSSTKTFKLLNAGSGDMNLEVSGSLSKGSGSFKIDHPVKPDTHSLYHSFVESPLTDLIYRGKAKLVKGKVSINIDEHFGMTDGTFVALVDDKQIFTTNEDTWDAVKGTVEENQLHIECQNESFEGYVSWLVIGDRKDKHIIAADWTDEKGKPILEVEK